MKRLVKDLSAEELRKVFENNNQLQADVQEDYEETQMFWINDYLKCFEKGLTDWCIGFYQHNYIKVKDINIFLNGLLKAQKDYGFLQDEYTPIVEKLIEKYNMFRCMDYDDSRYEEIENEIDEEVEKIKEAVIAEFNSQTDSPEYEYLENYFVDFYVEARLDEDCYIDDDYIMYKDVAYTMKYN